MMNRASLKAKLQTLFLGLAVFSALGGVAAYVSINRVVKNYSHVANDNFPSTVALADMRGNTRMVRLITVSLGLYGQSKDQIAELAKRIDESYAKFDIGKSKYTALAKTPDEQKALQAANQVEQQLRGLVATAVKLAQSDDPGAYTALTALLTGEFEQVGKKYTEVVNPMIEEQDKSSAQWVQNAQSAAEAGILTILAVSITCFVFSCLAGYFFAKSLTATFSELTGRLATGAGGVATASQQISAAGAQLSSATSEQAAALQETVASIDEVSAMVGKNADNAKRSLSVAQSSDQAASRGKEAVTQMLQAIDNISRGNDDIMQQTETSNREISSIVKVIAEIGNKTKVINDIVFQTKLLSFNASVEAARAGEHGKGFAVVAEEVGNLAQMSGNAAKEIAQMLEESMHKVERTVGDSKTRLEKLIGSGKERVETGLVTARRCGQSLDEIVQRVGELNHMVSEIATASEEQAKGVQEITKAMGQLDQVTQQNAAGAQEAARASASLNSEAASMRELVGVLEFTIHGAGALAAPAPRSAHPAATSQHHAASNIVPFSRKLPAPQPRAQRPRQDTLRQAVGAEGIPADDDPRFEDV